MTHTSCLWVYITHENGKRKFFLIKSFRFRCYNKILIFFARIPFLLVLFSKPLSFIDWQMHILITCYTVYYKCVRYFDWYMSQTILSNSVFDLKRRSLLKIQLCSGYLTQLEEIEMELINSCLHLFSLFIDWPKL